MNSRKALIHGLIVTAVMITVFVTAALTPARANAQTSEVSAAMDLVRTDIESRTDGQSVAYIPGNEVPLAAAPDKGGFNVSLWLIVVAVSAAVTGTVIYEDYKDKKSGII
ncbi:MAG: hypothetical protein K6G58_07180 [Lachnospiraceae bacterium]|nr:hypothetical protein [Lachnospiraceae bacterium]